MADDFDLDLTATSQRFNNVQIIDEVLAELDRADAIHGSTFNSLHEAYAVLKEEVDEYWQEVKHGTKERARAEIIQVAAMAIKTLRGLEKINK